MFLDGAPNKNCIKNDFFPRLNNTYEMCYVETSNCFLISVDWQVSGRFFNSVHQGVIYILFDLGLFLFSKSFTMVILKLFRCNVSTFDKTKDTLN